MKKFLLLLATLLSLIGSAFGAIDINSAPATELNKLKGIGPAKARAIVEYRQKNGPFKSVDDLGKVKGIGKATIDGFRGDVTVGGTRAATPRKGESAHAEKKPAEKK